MSDVDSEEEDRKEELRIGELHKEFYNAKLFLKAYKRNENAFDLKFPKPSFDKIIQLYGQEKIAPLSFILFSNPFEVQTIRYSCHNVNVRTSVQINSMLALLDTYYVYPKAFEGLDELEKIKLAPKLKPKYLNDIAHKMGLSFSEMINYISLQMTEINFRETMRTLVSYKIYQLVFNLIHLLNAKFPNKNNFEIAFYSYRKILKMAGIENEGCIPFLEMFTLENTNRAKINSERQILYEKVHLRELKESINEKIKDKSMDLYAGTDSCERIPKPDPLILEPFREEASNLLNRLIEEKERKEREERERIEREKREREERERQEREEKERLEREERERQEQEERERKEREEKERQEQEERERLEREEKERQEQEERERKEREEKERQEQEERERLEREEKERQEREERERLEREERERLEREKEDEKEPEKVIVDFNNKEPEKEDDMVLKNEVTVLRARPKEDKNKIKEDIILRRDSITTLKKRQFKIRRAVFVKVEKK